jgi:hypothetical protein
MRFGVGVLAEMSARDLRDAQLRTDSSFASFAEKEPSTRTGLQASARAVMEKITEQRALRLAQEARRSSVSAPEPPAQRPTLLLSKGIKRTQTKPGKIAKAKPARTKPTSAGK